MMDRFLDRRNGAIDILRGLTMFLMVFVNDLWTVGGVPRWIEHTKATQDGMGLADIVFPMFLFSVGMSVSLYMRPAMTFSPHTSVAHIF